jgi:adenosine deaminase
MSWFESLPKVELHVHLEGAIPHAGLWELIRKYGGDPSVPDLDALRRRLVYRNFSHFIETCSWKNQFLREYDDFTFIADGPEAITSTELREGSGVGRPIAAMRHAHP